MAATVSGDTQHAADVDKEKLNVELHRESDVMCAVSDYENGHLGIAHALVKSKADAIIRSDSYNASLLVAAEMGYTEIVKALIDYDGEINAVDENGETLLHLAARNDLNAVVEALLNQSVDRNARTRLKYALNQVLSAELEPSQHAIRNKVDVGHIATQGCSFELAKTQFSVKAITTGQAKPLHALLAAERGNKEIIENLILKGANVNACNKAKMTPLQLACQNGHSSIAEILLDNHDATVDAMKPATVDTIHAQETPFSLAAENGHADVVDMLLRRGICDFVAILYAYETPLHAAVENGNIKVVEVILKHSCRISDKLIKDEQKLQENDKNLVQTRGINPIKLKKNNSRRAYAEIVWTENITPLELMLDFHGNTALELAAKSIQPKMVKILLSVDPCVYSEKHLGNSFRSLIETIMLPVHQYELTSTKLKRRNIFDIILPVHRYEGISEQKPRNINDKEHKIWLKNIKEIAHLLMNSSKFNHTDDKLNTLLHKAVKQCGECVCDYLAKKSRPQILMIKTIDDVIQLLLEKGADFNMKNALGETPLMIASGKGCCHAIQKLFDWEHKSGLKLDLDARDQYGATALIKAAETHHVSVMRLLLNHKASVNLHDYYGFTALHAAVYEPNRDWCDLHFFCKGLCIRKLDTIEILVTRHSDDLRFWGRAEVVPSWTVNRLERHLRHEEKTTRFKEEMVKLLLAIEELNVNVIDFRENTPLDLAVKSSERITSETFKSLENRGAIQNTLEAKDEAPIEVARVDERGRSPLHRLIIFHISNYAGETMKAAKRQRELNLKIFDSMGDVMVHGIILNKNNFRQSATEADDKGRTPLHYAVMPSFYFSEKDCDLVSLLLEIGSNVNAADMYGKTPLHYAAMNYQYAEMKYRLLVENGADKNTPDKYGHTPRDLRQLRESVTINTNNATNLPFGKQAIYCTSADIGRVLTANPVTELSKRKLCETVRIHFQTPRSKESSEESIWKVWIENDFLSLNRRVSQLKPLIQRLIERLADGIKEKDWRFECHTRLVGSADEETKAVISADFDFNFRLTHFSQLCDVFPHPLGPKGYFQLRRTKDNIRRRQSDWEFDCFFNLDQCLLTNEVNSRFQIILEDILHSPNFWKDEHLFEWNLTDTDEKKLRATEKTAGLCKTVQLRMIHPIEDGEGGLLFVNVSIDVVACVQVEDVWLGDQLPVVISPDVKADGCTLVFDRPLFDRSKPRGAHYIFSDTFARISFAPQESRIIRESSSLIKVAYIICKLMLYRLPKATYQLKTSLLFCMEALKIREGCERKDEDEITQKELAFWVERIMFCFMQFYRHDVYPCYFMPSFRQQVGQLNEDPGCVKQYSVACDIYIDLCPDDTSIDIPIINRNYHITEGNPIVNQDPKWEQFDRKEFVRMLSSRYFHPLNGILM